MIVGGNDQAVDQGRCHQKNGDSAYLSDQAFAKWLQCIPEAGSVPGNFGQHKPGSNDSSEDEFHRERPGEHKKEISREVEQAVCANKIAEVGEGFDLFRKQDWQPLNCCCHG